MAADVEMNSLRLSGSKISRTERQNNYKTPRQRPADLNTENENYKLYLSTRVMENPITPPNSPLVMQMYSHKKARESVMKKVQEQTDRVKKKRLVYLKATPTLDPMPTPAGHENTKRKDVSPRNSNSLDSVTKTPKILPPINVNNSNISGTALNSGRKGHDMAERLYTTPLYQRHNKHRFIQELDGLTGKSNRKIRFDGDDNYKVDGDNVNDDDNDGIDDDNISVKENYDDNDSYDSIAIQSIFVNNCRYCNNETQHDSPWSHQRIPKNISWSPLQESYKGYLYKTNGDIVLTRKYQPPSHSSPSTKTRTGYNRKFKPHDKTYRWGYMDPGRILSKQIASLSISGTHA